MRRGEAEYLRTTDSPSSFFCAVGLALLDNPTTDNRTDLWDLKYKEFTELLEDPFLSAYDKHSIALLIQLKSERAPGQSVGCLSIYLENEEIREEMLHSINLFTRYLFAGIEPGNSRLKRRLLYEFDTFNVLKGKGKSILSKFSEEFNQPIELIENSTAQVVPQKSSSAISLFYKQERNRTTLYQLYSKPKEPQSLGIYSQTHGQLTTQDPNQALEEFLSHLLQHLQPKDFKDPSLQRVFPLLKKHMGGVCSQLRFKLTPKEEGFFYS